MVALQKYSCSVWQEQLLYLLVMTKCFGECWGAFWKLQKFCSLSFECDSCLELVCQDLTE